MRKIYVDCTGTYYSGFNTGIPRVIRNIVARKDFAKNYFSYEIVPIVEFDDSYRKVKIDTILSSYQLLPQLRNFGKKFLLKIKNKFSSDNIFIYFFIERFFRRIFSFLKYLNFKLVSIKNRKEIVHFDSKSVLICMDTFWTYDFEKTFNASNQGLGKFILGIHDLIPINYPDFVTENYKDNFENKLNCALKYVDQIVCVSDFTKLEVTNYIEKYHKKNIEIKSIKLGSELLPQRSKKISPEDLRILKNIFEGTAWLTVGTLERRKNQTVILDAFEKMWKKGSKDKLVLIGKIGSICDDLIERIFQHAELNSKLFYLQAAPDTWLEYAYKHARGLIFSSHVEGFGLPVSEALNYKLPVICSDIPAFREVAQDHALFFDQNDVDSLVNALEQKQIEDGDIPKMPTWDDFVENLLRSI